MLRLLGALWQKFDKYHWYFLFSGIILIASVWLYILGWGAEDYQQGVAVKIMYIHVPAAWMSSLIYILMTVMSFCYLVWRHILCSYITQAIAPMGAIFTIITLVTGALWGAPIWGSWWVWDARLTSVLILLLIYLAYIFLCQYSSDHVESSLRIRAIFVLFGSINIPIIKFSVEFWNSLHQKTSIISLDGPKIHSSMLIPLLLAIIGFTLLTIGVAYIRSNNLLLIKKIRRIKLNNI